MPTNIEYIIFAFNQMNEAENFGFKSNECNRNLKLALSHYWQNKTLGLHGQAHKEKIPKSRLAKQYEGQTQVEHAVPSQVIVNLFKTTKVLTTKKAYDILADFYRVIVVTKEEHEKLNAIGLMSKMPVDWDKKDPYARYRAAKISCDYQGIELFYRKLVNKSQ